jgi:hypothetical protein
MCRNYVDVCISIAKTILIVDGQAFINMINLFHAEKNDSVVGQKSKMSPEAELRFNPAN